MDTLITLTYLHSAYLELPLQVLKFYFIIFLTTYDKVHMPGSDFRLNLSFLH